MRFLRSIRRSDVPFIANGVVLVVAAIVAATHGNGLAVGFAGIALIQVGLAAGIKRNNDRLYASARRFEDIAERAIRNAEDTERTAWGRHLS